MINENYTKKFCKEDISKIENYDKAMNDATQIWHCHHRDEIRVLPSGMIAIRSKNELFENDRYYDCPANELIFLTPFEHKSLHSKNLSQETRRKKSESLKCRTFSEEHRKKLSEAKKGKTTWIKGKTLSEETRRKLSEVKKGKKYHKGITTSEFGKGFKEHYRITMNDNEKLYNKEYSFYVRHNCKFSWEIKQ